MTKKSHQNIFYVSGLCERRRYGSDETVIFCCRLDKQLVEPTAILRYHSYSALYWSRGFDTSRDVTITRLNTLKPRQNVRHFVDDMFKCILFNENFWISIKIPLKFVPEGPSNNIPPASVQVGAKPLSEPMMISSATHICVTWPQWGNVYLNLPLWYMSWLFVQ